VTLETGISAMESLGSGYVPAGLPTAFLGPGRHDAAQVGFDLTWDTACPCAKYVSKAFRIP